MKSFRLVFKKLKLWKLNPLQATPPYKFIQKASQNEYQYLFKKPLKERDELKFNMRLENSMICNAHAVLRE